MTSEVPERKGPGLDREARRVHDEYRSVRADRRTGIEVYFSTSPVPAETPVHVFQHTMKTAGTAVRALIYANLSASATYITHDAPKSAKHDDLAAWYRDFLEQFSSDEQSRLLWAVGHTAAHIAPLLGADLSAEASAEAEALAKAAVRRPVRLFTVVRQPVDQVVSRHWFAGRLETSGVRMELVEKLRQIYASPIAVKRKRHEGYWNLQSQSILAPYYDVMTLLPSRGPTADADLWRQRLSDLVERSVLLVQDRLDEGIRWFGAEQQWPVTSLPKVRVNRGRPAVADLDPELRAAIEEYNWLDVELYQQAVRRHDQRR